MKQKTKTFKFALNRLALVTMTLLGCGSAIQAATFVVDTTSDANLRACSAAPNDCSLRGAMANSNVNAGADTIAFNIPGSGYKTIAPTSALPTLSDASAFIDGNSQPGYVNVPLIVLSGAQISFSVNGLNITTFNCRVRGLTLQRWKSAIEISGTGAHSNTVEGCFIGTDATGLIASLNNIRGITLLDGARDNFIGGVRRNVITDNGDGILISGAGSDRNRVAGNIIGLNSRGELSPPAIGNVIGIRVNEGARHCFIGSPDAAGRNIISFNGTGVQLEGAQTAFHTLVNNYIGTDLTGNKAGFGNDGAGVSLNGAHSNRIGVSGAPRNVISGNGSFSDFSRSAKNIELISSHRNLIQNNFIGPKADGSGPVLAPVMSNAVAAGISIGRSSSDVPCEGTLIGGTEPGARNVISGNINYGIYLPSSIGTRIQGNFIGTNPAGTAAMPNTTTGIRDAGTGTLIGGTSPQARNVISGNGISNGGSSTFGVLMMGPNGVLQGNFIGTDARGTTALPNLNFGVYVARDGVIVGGLTNRPGTGPGNLISGNGQTGIAVDSSFQSSNSNVRVLGNLVGTDLSGLAAIPNGIGIILYTGQNTAIGSGQPGGRNIISGNLGAGVQFEGLDGTFGGSPRNARIQGNFIGTDISGQKPLPNVAGVRLQESSRTVIGGATNRPGTGAGNVISGNLLAGVYVERVFNVQPAIYGNAIGVAADGVTPMPNKKSTSDETDREGAGILAEQFAIIGGPSTNPGVPGSLANLIAYNEGAGVRVPAGQPARIRANSIFANGALGIDLGAVSVTANDAGDADTGGNELQNYPVLTSVTQNAPGSPLALSGTLDSTPDRQFAVDVYANSTPDPSGYGEGKIYLGSFNISTSGGPVTFNHSLDVEGDLSSKFITTTATGVFFEGNTSEFGEALPVEAQGATENSSSGFQGTAYASSASLVLALDTRLQSIAPKNLTAKVNGQRVPVQSIQISNQTLTVLLPDGSFAPGDKIEIFWRDLQAQDGRKLTGNTPTLVAE